MSRTNESPLEAGAANVHGLVPRATWEKVVTITIQCIDIAWEQEWFNIAIIKEIETDTILAIIYMYILK
jgi:hypothetical protein